MLVERLNKKGKKKEGKGKREGKKEKRRRRRGEKQRLYHNGPYHHCSLSSRVYIFAVGSMHTICTADSFCAMCSTHNYNTYLIDLPVLISQLVQTTIDAPTKSLP